MPGRIRRLAEPVQFDPELLAQLKQFGILPGAQASFSNAGSYVRIEVDGVDGGLELPNESAGPHLRRGLIPVALPSLRNRSQRRPVGKADVT